MNALFRGNFLILQFIKFISDFLSEKIFSRMSGCSTSSLDSEIARIIGMPLREAGDEAKLLIAKFAIPSTSNIPELKSNNSYKHLALVAFFRSYSDLSFNGSDKTVSAASVRELDHGSNTYLIFGEDSAEEYCFAIKKGDSENIYEMIKDPIYEPEVIGEFERFVLLRHLIEIT